MLNRPFAHGVIGWDSGLLLEGQPDVAATGLKNPTVNFEAVTPAYFQSMGIRLRRGRDFSSTDRAAAPLVAVVSDNLAARLWPGQNPIGKPPARFVRARKRRPSARSGARSSASSVPRTTENWSGRDSTSMFLSRRLRTSILSTSWSRQPAILAH